MFFFDNRFRILLDLASLMYNNKRFWEIDFLRGIAILMMVIFHLVYDLSVFGSFNFDVFSGFWLYFGKTTAIIFLLLVGISLTISYNIHRQTYFHFLKRGMILLFYALILTLVTWIFLKERYIRFGILHLIGTSILIVYPFLRLKWKNLFWSIIFILLGFYFNQHNSDIDFFLPLKFKNTNLNTVDFYPFLPWFGVIIGGVFLGNVFLPKYKSSIDLSPYLFIKFLFFLGRRSLLIYFIHQPILLLLLLLIGLI